MFREKAFIFLLFLSILSSYQSYGRTLNASIRIRNDSSDEPVLNRTNLIAIKQFIIKKGIRESISQMYNNNPAYHTKKFAFYMNPDTGQKNINCEIDKSDFQTLVIRRSENKNQYCDLNFQDEFNIYISISWPTEDLAITQIREFATEAVKEILQAIENSTASKPGPIFGTNFIDVRDAIDVAISTIRNLTYLPNDEYIITSVQRDFINKNIWRITFKSTKELLTIGGEIFVNVDLNTKKTKITHGE
jgi:hypothetical protein